MCLNILYYCHLIKIILRLIECILNHLDLDFEIALAPISDILFDYSSIYFNLGHLIFDNYTKKSSPKLFLLRLM